MGRSWAPTVVGGLAWVGLVAGGAATDGLDLVAALLALAPLVLVPAALPLHGRPAVPVGLVVGAAVPAGVALLLPRGWAAAVLAGPWLLVVGLLALDAARAWLVGGRRLRAAVPGVALGYLTVGAGWLVADRLGLEPAGFAPPFVALTAVHFHHAGFVATTVVATVAARAGRRGDVALALVVAGPPVVAVGFVAVPTLQVVGAVLLTAGLWTFAVATWRAPLPDRARAPLRLAGLATLAPMALAVHWATGSATDWWTPLDIPTMAATHGAAQALGFGLLGVVGCRLAVAARPGAERGALAGVT